MIHLNTANKMKETIDDLIYTLLNTLKLADKFCDT